MFSNNKQSHHDASAIVKDYPNVSQLDKFFKNFPILAFSSLWLLLGK